MAYSDDQKIDVLNRVCSQMIEGKSLRSIFKSEDMPDLSTFFDWINKNEDFSNRYARAMELRAQMMFEDILDESEKKPDLMESKFGVCVDPASVQNRRLLIDTKKWAASKMLPKKYGDNLEFYEKLKADKEREERGDNKIIIEIVENSNNYPIEPEI